jgi:hypothetical protein
VRPWERLDCLLRVPAGPLDVRVRLRAVLDSVTSRSSKKGR